MPIKPKPERRLALEQQDQFELNSAVSDLSISEEIKVASYKKSLKFEDFLWFLN